MNLGSLDENQESQPPDQQGLEARSYFSLDLCPQWKMKANTVNAGTKFIIRGIAQQQVGQHTRDGLFCWDRNKAEMHTPERKSVGVTPSEEERCEEVVKSFI